MRFRSFVTLLAAVLAAGAARAQPGLFDAAEAAGASLHALALPEGFYLEDVSGGGPYLLPVAVAFAPDGRLFVVEKRGVVWVVRDGQRRPQPFLDLRAEVMEQGERGMLGIALDPRFAENGRVYLAYTVDRDSTGDRERTDVFGRVTRYAARADDPDRADLASRRVLLGETFTTGIPACSPTHAPATLAFGSDGTLLVGTGDAALSLVVDDGGEYPDCFGEGRLDPSEDIGAYRAQRVESLAGKVLRVDPETGLGLPSNPFFTGDPADNASRVWLLGLRNPFRFAVRPGGSADPGDGRPGALVLGDVGWWTWEELDVAHGGENYGWPCDEGPVPNALYRGEGRPATNGCEGRPVFAHPVAYWHHTGPHLSLPPGLRGWSVTGGAFNTGDRYPEAYDGAFFVSDVVAGWMLAVRFDEEDRPVAFEPFGAALGPVVQTPFDTTTGTLHLVNYASGRVLRLRHAGEDGNRPPTAVLEADPTQGGTPLLVRFSAAGSADPDGDSLTYSWEFGDGEVAPNAGPNVTHVYALNGRFTAAVAVSDGRYTTTATVEIALLGAPPDLTIRAPAEGEATVPGATVPLRALATDPEGGLVRVDWTVAQVHGDHEHPDVFTAFGTEAEFPVPEHGEPGDLVYYRIEAKGADPDGNLVVVERALRVAVPGEVDVAPEATPVARVTEPAGSGSPTLEVIRDGVMPPRGSTDPLLQFDTFDGEGGADEDWVGYTFAAEQRLRRLTFQEGLEADGGGWFDSLRVEVRRDGAWHAPAVLHVLPPYRGADGVGFDTYTLLFSETPGDAVRLVGPPGGDERFVSVAELQAFALRPGTLPEPWTAFDVGGPEAAGAAAHAGGTFTLEGGGHLAPGADTFPYVYRALDADGTVTARLASLQGRAARAGLMLRSGLGASASHAALLATPGGVHVRHRPEEGAPAEEHAAPEGTPAPVWLRLQRTGDVVTGYVSADGARWAVAGSAVVAAGRRAYVGLAVSAEAEGERAAATFDSVRVEALPAGALPWPWAAGDVGAPAGGSAAYAAGRYIVEGAGAVGGAADAFRFVHQPAAGTAVLTARLDSLAGPGAEAGLMVRAGLDAQAPHAFLLATPAGVRLRARPTPGAPPEEVVGPDGPPPVWLRLEWRDGAVSAFTSPDGQAWTRFGVAGVDLSHDLLAGLAVAGADVGQTEPARATFAAVGASGAGAAVTTGAGPGGAGPVGAFGIEAAYPNPSRRRATLRLAVDRPGRVTVEVFDVLGRRVLTHALVEPAPSVREVVLDVSALPAGSYVVRARHEGGGQDAVRIAVVK